jgi:hypothetical protein
MGDLLYRVFGLGNSGPWYGMWSGFGSFLPTVAMLGATLLGLRKWNCQMHGCWRLGRHEAKRQDGTTVRVCRHHHPKGPLAPEHLAEAGREDSR